MYYSSIFGRLACHKEAWDRPWDVVFAELKRRNVYCVAALYVIVSWLLLQAADVFTSFLPLPDWTRGLIFLLLVIGFPVVLIFAWAFELTPEGL